MVGSSDESESGRVGLLLLRRFVCILFSNVCLKLVRCAKTSPCRGRINAGGVLNSQLLFSVLRSLRNCVLPLSRWWICVIGTSLWQYAVVIVAQRIELLHLHTRIILLSSVLLAVPVLLIEDQDAVFEDERVVPVYLGGERSMGYSDARYFSQAIQMRATLNQSLGNSDASYSELHIHMRATLLVSGVGSVPQSHEWATAGGVVCVRIKFIVCDTKVKLKLDFRTLIEYPDEKSIQMMILRGFSSWSSFSRWVIQTQDLAVELLLRSFGSLLSVVALILCIVFAYLSVAFLMMFVLLSILWFDPDVPLGLVYCCLYVFSGFSAGRGFDPAGGAPGGG
ncbi:hypothetical protein F511_11542 [Dorcoceras hygrometricum]|uniref:Uncharacterized protein n=1 Tax=Dorcoceras hygrometricum TaxID=472368 RepID=A0A2Z7ABG7_9LAMI|nr:hypothetical protein F511_11542 [Dorcoceras hygrometricum]